MTESTIPDLINQLERDTGKQRHAAATLLRTRFAALAARIIDPGAFKAITQEQARLIFGEWLEDGTLVRASLRARREKALAKVDAILGALATPVGEGWVMVPREPTEAMMDAGAVAMTRGHAVARAAYRAMIAATPSAQET